MWCKSLTLEKYISFRMKWFFSPPFLSVSPFLLLNLARRQSYAYAVGLYTRPEIKSWPDVKFWPHAQCVLPRCLAEEPLRLRSEVLRSFIARHCFTLWVGIAKYSFKETSLAVAGLHSASVISNILLDFWKVIKRSFAKLLIRKVFCTLHDSTPLIARFQVVLLILCVLLEKLRCGESITCETRHLYQLYLFLIK